MIRTKVKLEDGKTVDAYYLGKFEKGVFERLVKLPSHDFLLISIRDLEDAILNILKPKAENAILDFLKVNPHSKTGLINNFCGVHKHKFERRALYQAFEDLERRGRIIPVSHGPGHHRTWSIGDMENGKEATKETGKSR